MEWKYRKIAIDRCEKMTKNHSKDVYFDSIFSLTSWLKKIGQYKVRCRIEWATKWEKKIFGRPCLNLPKSENTGFCTWWKTRVTYSFSIFLHSSWLWIEAPEVQVCSAGHELSNTIKVKWKKPEKSREKVKNTFSSILTIFSAFFRCVLVVYSLFQELLGLKPWYFGISYRSLCLTFLRCQNPKTRTLMFWSHGEILDFFMDCLLR